METYKGLKELTDFEKEWNQRINTIWFQNYCVSRFPTAIKAVDTALAQKQTNRSMEKRVQKQTQKHMVNWFLAKMSKSFNRERMLFPANGTGQLASRMETLAGCSTLLYSLPLWCTICMNGRAKREAYGVFLLCDMNLISIRICRDISCSIPINWSNAGLTYLLGPAKPVAKSLKWNKNTCKNYTLSLLSHTVISLKQTIRDYLQNCVGEII